MVSAKRAFVNGCMYEVQHRGWEGRVKLVRYDAIERTHIVAHNGKEMRLDLSRMRSVKRERARPSVPK